MGCFKIFYPGVISVQDLKLITRAATALLRDQHGANRKQITGS